MENSTRLLWRQEESLAGRRVLVVDANEGPLLLELNARPGLAIQMANGRGLLPRLRAIEALKRPHFTPLERSRFAMDTFASF